MGFIDQTNQFKKHPVWQQVLGRMQIEFKRQVSANRSHARDGHVARTAYATGYADALEWVSHLPDQIRSEYVKDNLPKEENTDAKPVPVYER